MRIKKSQLQENIKLPPFKKEEVLDNLQNQSSYWHLDQYNIPEYWSQTQGEGINILVLDTGMPDHKDLAGKTNFLGNFSKENTNQDLNGHQTHCNGIINGKITGVAPKAKVFVGKVLNKNGSGDFKSVIHALKSALTLDVDIISMSLGGTQEIEEFQDVINELTEANKTVICAAGNSGERGVSYPAKYKNTIAISAHDEQTNIAYFSSKGEEVDFAAPGVKITSTYLNQSYAKLSGTSMACPFIVGLVALMLSKHKKQESQGKVNNCKTPEQIYEHLKRCSIDYGETGKDSSYGYGLIDSKTLIEVKPKPEPNPEPNPEPDPEPEPEPKPKPEKPKDNWFKRNMAWLACGTFIIIALIFYLTSLIQSKTEVYVPYIDEDGNVNWDKKLEEELESK